MDATGWHAARWSHLAARSHAGTETLFGPVKGDLSGKAIGRPGDSAGREAGDYFRAV
jgi:hypothetical protein